MALQAPFSKLEYKPEYLITEVGIARARLRLDALTSTAAPAAQSSQYQRQVLPAPQSQPAPEAKPMPINAPSLIDSFSQPAAPPGKLKIILLDEEKNAS